MFEINMLTCFCKCSLTKNIYLNKWISVTGSLPSRPFSMRWWGMSCQKVYCLSNWSRVEGDWESSIDLVSLCILFKLKFLWSCDHRGRVGVGGLCWFRSLVLDQFKSFNIVFIFQRHNTIEHAGHMSRSQRNAALQVHVVFTFRTHP